MKLFISTSSLITLILIATSITGCDVGSTIDVIDLGSNTNEPPVITVPVTGGVSLTWTIPTSRENGNALTLSEIGGFYIFHSTTPDILSFSKADSILIPDNATTTYTYEGLTAGNHCYRISTFDTDTLESVASTPPVCITLN